MSPHVRVDAEHERDDRPRREELPPTSLGSPVTLLQLQRTAGNQSVARALAARRTLQRMTVLAQSNDGRELVAFEPDEPQPPLEDGYEYERAGSDGRRMLYKRKLVSHQGKPEKRDQRGPGLRSGVRQTNYGTFTPPNSTSGGTVTPNPSKHFPQQAALDYSTYAVGVTSGVVPLQELFANGYQGYGRMIDGSDVETLADQIQMGAQKLAKEAGEGVAARGAAIISSLRSLWSGGEGTTVVEEKIVREKLTPVVDDPRVVHYLLLHSRGDLGRSGTSLLVSKLTVGISAMVEKGASATAIGALGTELGLLARTLAEADAKQVSNAHSDVELVGRTPQDLIDSIGELALHFGGSTVVEGLKAIPFYVGTAVGAMQTLTRKFGGSTDAAQAACRNIQSHAARGQQPAVQVIKLLGVPLEVALASGGDKALIMRL